MLTASDRERIERLRAAAVEPRFCHEAMYLGFWREWERRPELDDRERYARSYYTALSQLTPEIEPDELIVGHLSAPLTEADADEWHRLAKVAGERVYAAGQDSHMAVDYDLLLERGIDGIISIVDSCLEKLGENDSDKAAFYRCCRTCLEAVKTYSSRYANRAELLAAECCDPRRAAELRTIADICRRVPAGPAESFWEAVQSVHFVTHCLTLDPFRYFAAQQFQLGRPDRYLYRYYKADVERGAIDDATAQCLFDCLAIQINRRVPRGLSSGYMLGGHDNGKPVANELTLMGMRAVDDIRLVYPSVGLCWTRDMPDEYLDCACEILSHGRSHPAIFNDDVISKGIQLYGLPESDSHMYIHSTCVEITPIASSNVWVASPYTNMPGLLLELLDRDYADFESLMNAYFERLSNHIRANFDEQNRIRALRAERGMTPLLSCFVHDCLRRGVDIEQGGARYNWIMPSFVGMANLVDSLHAIRTLIFERGELTLAELKTALDQNFEGFESLRLKLLNRCDKYGNDNDRVDELFGRIIDFIVAECKKYTPMFTNGHLVPSVFCWIMHEQFGRSTGATPDGRLAGFPLGDGSGPCQGREKRGPTASILSSTKWSHTELIGGVAVNMKFTKKTFNADSRRKAAELIRAYLARGGFEIQINIVDRDTLLAARENPEDWRDLVVRIGGYSDYFVRLSPEMQEEVLLRTEHEI